MSGEDTVFSSSKVQKILFVTFVILLLGSILLVPGYTKAQKPTVGGDHPETITMEAGEEKKLDWTVSLAGESAQVVSVDVEGLGDWKEGVTPSYFVLDERESYKIVSLEFKVPQIPDKEERDITVEFSYRELNTSEIDGTIEKNITIEVGSITHTGKPNSILGGFENPLPGPLNNPYGAFLLNVLIWVTIAFLSFFLVTPIILAFTRKTDTPLDDLVVKMIRRPLLLLISLYGLIHSVMRLKIQLSIKATIYQVYFLFAVIIGIYVTYNIFDGVLDEIAYHRGGEDSTFSQVLQPVLEKLGAIVILVGGLILGLNIMGVEVTAVLAGAGVLGLVIAFAAQDTLSNFFSGMHLLIDRPFTIGDLIQLEGGEYCQVVSVGMRSTKLYSIFDHEEIVIPNNMIANQQIINLEEPDTKMRVSVDVGVAYGSDLEKVNDILEDVVHDHDDIITEGEFSPVIRFKEFGDSSLDFTVRFWVDDYMKQWEVASEIRDRIDKRFRDAEVTIPFPQRTVWMKNEKG